MDPMVPQEGCSSLALSLLLLLGPSSRATSVLSSCGIFAKAPSWSHKGEPHPPRPSSDSGWALLSQLLSVWG